MNVFVFQGKVHCKAEESQSRRERLFSGVQTRGHQATKFVSAHQKHNTFLGGFLNSKNSCEKFRINLKCNAIQHIFCISSSDLQNLIKMSTLKIPTNLNCVFLHRFQPSQPIFHLQNFISEECLKQLTTTKKLHFKIWCNKEKY